MINFREKKYRVVLGGTIFFILLIYEYLHLPMFGSIPSGDRLARIEKSPNYKNGYFHNINETTVFKSSPLKAIKSLFFQISPEVKPATPSPTIKTNLRNLNPLEDILVWFGHSSYFVQIEGKRLLVDPLFSEVSSPVPFFPRAFAGTNIYDAEDMPEIDYLIITHDHWDHLDYETMLKLKHKSKWVICGLGVGAHLERWGFKKEQIIEMDWNESLYLEQNFTIHCLTSHHFSGRWIPSRKSLWASFLIETPILKVYIGGDSGYGAHYKQIGRRFPGIDLAILNAGQYNIHWRYNHLMTEEVVQAVKDLGAKMLLPIHLGKIALSNHPWNEPLNEITKLSLNESFSVLTPMIGEIVYLKRTNQTFTRWWENVK
ncbi:MAG: MBL fold metallo-hydrolase [Holosporaceae bacterium]|jgi:L-ascorbate metabolism protein UlaG (beta-lactamase superfamily)|nr:MBL fold metallo-hydrolase [Holosporaceae bacterium]